MPSKGGDKLVQAAKKWLPKIFDESWTASGSMVGIAGGAKDATSRDAPVSSQVFEHIYRDPKNHNPMWDVQRPQGEIIRLENMGKFRGTILDLGCGVGDNAIYLGQKGYNVVGVDLVKSAIEEAKSRLKAAQSEQRLAGDVQFIVADVLALQGVLGPANLVPKKYDVMLDSAAIHCLGNDDNKLKYLLGLRKHCRRDTELILMCHSDKNPNPKDGSPWKGPQRMNDIALKMLLTKAGWEPYMQEEVRYDDRISEGGGMYAHLFVSRLRSDAEEIVRGHQPPERPPSSKM